MRLALGWLERRRAATLRVGARRFAVACCVAALAAPLATMLAPRTGAHPAREDFSFHAAVLDVGQGDAILLDPPGGDPILVDGGPPGGGLRAKLSDLGVERLAAAIVTHDQSDHAGGVEELLGAIPVGQLLYSRAGRELLGAATASGTPAHRLSEGGEIESGALRVSVLWPPRELLDAPLDDPNQQSLVLLAEWRHLSILLTGDTEAEAAPIDPGPVDVLKVAHHGSADSGLDPLLDRLLPRVAVISVGENSYGHPTPETLGTLREHDVRTLRTDEDGTVEIDADEDGWGVD
jgi:competence protein ComEC